MMATQFEIGVIGAGNAAEGIVHGILRKSVLFDDRLVVSDPVAARRELFANRFNVAVTDDNRYLVENSYIVLLSVKPQQSVEVCQRQVELGQAGLEDRGDVLYSPPFADPYAGLLALVGYPSVVALAAWLASRWLARSSRAQAVRERSHA